MSTNTVITGQASDIPILHHQVVLDIIKAKWPPVASGSLPAKTDITFSLQGFLGNKSFQISTESGSAPNVTQLALGRNRLERHMDEIIVHIWVRKNSDVIPDSVHLIRQKIEDIVNANVVNVPYGITSMMLKQPFNMVELSSFFTGSQFQNETEISLWHSQAVVELMYFKSTTSVTAITPAVTRTHKFNIET